MLIVKTCSRPAVSSILFKRRMPACLALVARVRYRFLATRQRGDADSMVRLTTRLERHHAAGRSDAAEFGAESALHPQRGRRTGVAPSLIRLGPRDLPAKVAAALAAGSSAAHQTWWPYLGLNKCQQVGIDRVGLGGAHAMREALVDLERRVLDDLRA